MTPDVVVADPHPVEPVPGPLDAVVEVPGSKSLTNRALVTAALAAGESTLEGVLQADDTEAMVSCLGALGATVAIDWRGRRGVVHGTGGSPRVDGAELDARLSGTTARFVLPLLGLGAGRATLDGAAPLRARPMADGIGALRQLGGEVTELGAPGHLPVVVSGGPVAGGEVEVDGAVSSQFLSGLLLVGPCLAGGLRVRVRGALVSESYVRLTAEVMAAFGAEVQAGERGELRVAGGGYRPTHYRVEPDASAASYFFAAAAICGGRVRVDGLGGGSTQGDIAFVGILEAMGATVERGSDHLEVRVEGPLHGVRVDMADCSDTAQTLAAVAPFAEGPTEVTGIGFIRRKETDRIGAVVAELRRCGIDARETPDGFVVEPGVPRPAVVNTYDDHRMAMSFALLGLRTAGIRIADPGCVAKTFPGYWAALEALGRIGDGRRG